MKRDDGRIFSQMRPITITPDMFGYAPGSVFVQVGNTKVICSVTMQTGVPTFLRGKKQGWLTAEYAMLPCATQIRTHRAGSGGQPHGRSVEISRLIGRVLRTVIDFSQIPDYTITIDCDVLQADGGTRTACVNGAYAALVLAQNSWLSSGLLEKSFIIDSLAAVSVGVLNGHALLDPSFKEDSTGQADFNFVIAKSGGVIETQGGAEKGPVSWELFDQARLLAVDGVQQWFTIFDGLVPQSASPKKMHEEKEEKKSEHVPLFSLKNRLQNSL